MKYIFYLEYHTSWEEEVKLLGSSEQLGGNITTEALPMSTDDGIHWQLTIDIKKTKDISYRYLISCHGKVIREEALYFARPLPQTDGKLTIIQDRWLDKPTNSPTYSSAFTEVWNKQEAVELDNIQQGLQINTFCSDINSSQILAILGNHPKLGNWNSKEALILNGNFTPSWSANITYEELENTNELVYKYVVLNKETREIEAWEEGENRVLVVNELDKRAHNTQIDRLPIFSRNEWRAAGLAVPVFSLRSKDSWGIGEFLDIKLLVDWAVKTNLKLLQLLPVNDTTLTNTWDDSYPYRCTSVFALNPIYLNLERLGINETEFADDYQTIKLEINKLKTIDFPLVQAKKQFFTHEIFKRQGKETLSSSDYKLFYNENKEWLTPYAIYLYLRNKYNTADTSKWEEYASYSEQFISEFSKAKHEAKSDLEYVYFTQYHLYCQLKEASIYAKNKSVVLKGDLPIGISLHSADAWVNARYFHINGQAGAPPDDFAQEGQNWGFPTYNWIEIEKDDFSWWKNRLSYMSEFFQAYRIDHILGFFRIWTIPRTAIYGTLGQFSPALPFSREELEHLNFEFDEKLHLNPYITAKQLEKIQLTATQIKALFKQDHDDLYHFKEAYNTQSKLNTYLQSAKAAKIDDITKTQLLQLHTEVLFVVDINQKNLYHPRIDAYKTAIYHSLSNTNKVAFDLLYHDFFYVKHNEFWKQEALVKLPKLIQSSRMLVCGEDLGMIPLSVPEVMQSLDILRLEIERMPKTEGVILDNPSVYPYQSVSAFSTHDMSTLRGWWEESREQANHLHKEIFGDHALMPEKLSPEIAYHILNRELCGKSMLNIQALQDWLSLTDRWYLNITPSEEQINIPANIHNRWQYRIPGYLEELLEDNELINSIQSLLSKSERI